MLFPYSFTSLEIRLQRREGIARREKKEERAIAEDSTYAGAQTISATNSNSQGSRASLGAGFRAVRRVKQCGLLRRNTIAWSEGRCLQVHTGA